MASQLEVAGPPGTAGADGVGGANMASMSGAALPKPSAGPRLADSDLFTGLVVSNPPRQRRTLSRSVSIAGHVLVLALVVLVPILWQDEPPAHTDYIRALLYNPPPPPPPPLPKGSAVLDKQEAPKPTTPEVQPQKPEFTAPVEEPVEDKLKPEAKTPETEQAGSATGSDMGVPEGMEVGVEGGVVGGVPGGVIGGVIGGTGDIPVMDYDTPPRVIKQTRPIYPQDAFIKKIEGVVEVEILIDTSGRVARARVMRSVPLLDQAAIDTVKQWVFAPAVKGGRPVATTAIAPVTFRIY
jgi:periplasmic protein TonB